MTDVEQIKRLVNLKKMRIRYLRLAANAKSQSKRRQLLTAASKCYDEIIKMERAL